MRIFWSWWTSYIYSTVSRVKTILIGGENMSLILSEVDMSWELQVVHSSGQREDCPWPLSQVWTPFMDSPWTHVVNIDWVMGCRTGPPHLAGVPGMVPSPCHSGAIVLLQSHGLNTKADQTGHVCQGLCTKMAKCCLLAAGNTLFPLSQSLSHSML